MQAYIRRLSRMEHIKKWDWLVFFAGYTILHIPAILNFNSKDGSNNAYLLFTESLLKGKLSLPENGSAFMDMIYYQGHHYLPYPPFPSILLMPFVAIFGEAHLNTVVIALMMSCLNFYLMYKIFLRIGVEQKYISWLMAAFFLGTGYWYALFTTHHVYSFAHITSCSLQLLVIYELTGKKRWWLLGAYIGCSFLCRQFTIFYFLFALGYMVYLYQKKLQQIKFVHFVSFCASLGVFVGIYFLYNYLRFSNPLDPGYKYISYIGVLKERVDMDGIFSIKYLPFNLYSFFIKGFNIDFTGNGLMHIKDMDLWGTSIIAASPFVILSLKSEWPKTLKIAAWATILVIMGGFLFYHNNGFHQVNCMRFALDFLPLLFVLIALGVKQVPFWLLKSFVLYSVFLNILAFVIHMLYHTLNT